jgi:hypothetical protein
MLTTDSDSAEYFILGFGEKEGVGEIRNFGGIFGIIRDVVKIKKQPGG